MSAAEFLRYALLACALAYVAVYVAMAYFRIRYPFELEWMEGGVLEHVRRVLEGKKLYVAPSLEFVSFVYPPLYYYLSAGLAKLLGLGFAPLRLISFLASAGCFVFIYLMVRRETGRNFPAVLASCLFAAMYGLSGFWFDLARVDSLFLFFLLPALYLLRFRVSPASYVLAGVFVGLSFLSKQSALAISLPLMLYAAYADRRAGAAFIVTAGGIMGLSTVALNRVFDGWYTYYVFGIIAEPTISRKALLGFWTHDMLFPLFFACTVSAFFLYSLYTVSRNRDRKVLMFYGAMAAGMLGAAWAARMHAETWPNVLFPAYATVAILFGLGLSTLLDRISSLSPGRHAWVRTLVYGACIVQFAELAYNPFPQLPTKADVEAGRKLVGMIKQVDGEVYVPYHGYLAALAGKKTYAHAMAISDFLRCTDELGERTLVYQAQRALERGGFSAVIIDTDPNIMAWFNNMVKAQFTARGPAFGNDAVFWPKTGMRTRPATIYVAKK